MYNFHSKCLMKCLNEFFNDCLIFYGVDLNNGQFVQSSSKFQQWKPSFVQGQGRCHAKGSEGSTEQNQPRTQPWRHKEGGGRSICMSRFIAVQQDNADRR